jgi:hypothetical protein
VICAADAASAAGADTPPAPPADTPAAPAAGAAPSSAGGSTYDWSQLPAVSGTVAHYTLTPRGDVDGLVLTDGTEVSFPPHLSTELVIR